MFSAVIAGNISASLFPECCERAGLSRCRPLRHSPPPHSSVPWGHRYAPTWIECLCQARRPRKTQRETCNWISKFLWLPFDCFLCQQNTWGAKYFWSCGDMGARGQFNPPRPLAPKPLWPVCSSERELQWSSLCDFTTCPWVHLNLYLAKTSDLKIILNIFVCVPCKK